MKFLPVRISLAPLLLSVLVLAAAVPAVSETLPSPGEILIKGIVSSVAGDGGSFVVSVTAVRESGAAADTLLAARADKRVTVSSSARLLFGSGKAASAKDLVPGLEIAAAGKNLGKGKDLPAREVTLFAPEGDAPVAAGNTAPPPSAPPAPPSGVGPSAPPTIRPAAQLGSWRGWNDPAGMVYEYPDAWPPSGAPGSNPTIFAKAPLALSVRRLPVNKGETSQSRADIAMETAKAFAASHSLRLTQSATAVAGIPSRSITLRGQMQGADYAQLLGVPAASASAGPGVVHMAFVPIPENIGRQKWALEVACGGPEASGEAVSQVMQRVLRSIRLKREAVQDAPNYISPIRVAKTVEIENALKQVGTAMLMYMSEDDTVPPNWEALAPYLGGSTKFMTNLKQGWPDWQVGPVQLLQPGKQVSSLGNPSAAIVARTDGPGFSVLLFADGHVSRVNR